MLLVKLWCVESSAVSNAELEKLEQDTERNRQMLAHLDSQPVSSQLINNYLMII